MVTKKLKIVVVYFDNHPGAVMGCVGNSEVHTPNLSFEISSPIQMNACFICFLLPVERSL